MPLRPDGQFSQAARRRRPWGTILAVLGALVVLGGLAGGALYLIVGQGLLAPRQQTVASVASPAPAGSPILGAAPVPAASPAQAAAASSPAPSPTPLALSPPSPTLRPTRPPAPSPTARPAATGLPPPVIFATPPGLRFASATPIRLGTPQPTRTPLPMPASRPPTFTTRVWSEQVLHRIGEDASICGQSSSGSRAELSVIPPDHAPRTLGEFATPSERVCYSLTVDQAELWVLQLIVRDASGAEVERQAAALWVSR